ncbi:hypothetical protein [uncultured Gammaproteobacteria bacterium]|nr:hypothetical protein [uncultured Gammaproteobacteria bacterium]CAC9592624.1 hypothetical protein [uncultured Gammaproteobacteria bacterium]CAC9963328.1 hypothetical protein [uncultured Gammaproteobacteria bacterium]CAC9967680.1 hypothetical protein [uncultured Gammaproteobacteria bacterium]CAC9968177.1 hypothetical protein [uncultured Gammaproteobacteria bacterium]
MVGYSANLPPHRWLRKSPTYSAEAQGNLPPHRWLRNLSKLTSQ